MRWLAAAIVAVAALAAPGTSWAWTATAEESALLIAGDAGEAAELTIKGVEDGDEVEGEGEDKLIVEDRRAAFRGAVPAGCQLASGRLECDRAEIESVEVHGRDRNDKLQSSAEGLQAVLYGEEGDDTLKAGSEPGSDNSESEGDELSGGPGADILEGGGGDDVLRGGDGDDQLKASGGSDTMLGEAGNDKLSAGDDGGRLEGGEGNDTIDGGEAAERLAGGPGNDRLAGGGEDDALSGDEGADRLDGGEGHDRLSGGAGDDRLDGDGAEGDGNDELSGDAGKDVLDGGGGHDRLSGGQGDDTLSADDGDDQIFGEEGSDRLAGGSGHDGLSGGVGDDGLNGDEGNDRMSGEAGADELNGGPGADLPSGGSGHDLMSYSGATDGVALTIDGIANDGSPGERDNVGSDIERAEGGDGDDDLQAGGPLRQLSGGSGNDTLTGTSADETFAGGDGNDRLRGRLGSDILTGDDGTDTVTYAERRRDLTVTLNDGRANDGQAGERDRVDASVENVRAGSGDDRLVGVTGVENRLDGREGDDVLRGRDKRARDRFRGATDTYLCRRGNDRIDADSRDKLPGECENARVDGRSARYGISARGRPTLLLSARPLVVDRHGRASLPLRCGRDAAARCRARVRLSVHGSRLASVRVKLRAKTHRRMRLRLTRSALRLLGRRYTRVQIRISVPVRRGRPATASGSLPLRYYR